MAKTMTSVGNTNQYGSAAARYRALAPDGWLVRRTDSGYSTALPAWSRLLDEVLGLGSRVVQSLLGGLLSGQDRDGGHLHRLRELVVPRLGRPDVIVLELSTK